MQKAWLGAQEFQQQYGNLQKVAGRSTVRPWPGALGPAHLASDWLPLLTHGLIASDGGLPSFVERFSNADVTRLLRAALWILVLHYLEREAAEGLAIE